ncbi:glycosyl transferase [Treponema rectale]|uniref:Glycosyl transferase n=1 Tax=Treponema rectale TaxID=744512 RepID=A0A7M1XIG7_9SPIR|nr:glycosyl transferase [Treponema rectale]
MVKKIIKHLIKGDLIQRTRARIYINKNLSRANNDPAKYLIGLGKISLGYKMNLNVPRSLNEKLNYYKIHYYNPLMSDVVDKVKAKDYVKSKGLEKIIIPTIGVFDNISEVDISNFPNEFVIKNSMDSGGVYICRNKANFSFEKMKEKLLVKNDIFYHNGLQWALETAYKKSENKIIAEELLKTEGTPWDYKFFCFNGEPRFLFVGSDRDSEVKFDFFDINFNYINVKNGHPHQKNKTISKPKNYDKMLEICRVLSKDFPHVRVDLYNLDGNIYFGELTFYHNAAFSKFKPRKFDFYFGRFFDIKSIDDSVFHIV